MNAATDSEHLTSRRWMTADPLAPQMDRNGRMSTRAHCPLVIPSVLPILRPGVIPVDQRPPVTVLSGYIPVVTISLFEAHSFYNLFESTLTDLVRFDLLSAVGDPGDVMSCFVDLESAARAFALVSRGEVFDWTWTTVTERIRTPSQDEDRLRRLLARFMLAHLRTRSHQRGIVGFRPAEIDHGGNLHPLRDLGALSDYVSDE